MTKPAPIATHDDRPPRDRAAFIAVVIVAILCIASLLWAALLPDGTGAGLD